MAISYRDLFDVNLKYFDYVAKKTLVIHQYLHGISASGAGVENEIRELLRKMVPSRFRVTHGYILSVSDPTSEPRISPQVDVIIVDTLVPHSLWAVDDNEGAEVVPIEAVVAIFEVKRTLSEKALNDAVDQIRKIRDRIGIDKYADTGYLPGGVAVGSAISSPYRSNPLLGIVGVIGEAWFTEQPRDRFKELTKANSDSGKDQLELDLIFTIDGTLIGTAHLDNPDIFRFYNVREHAVVYPVREASGSTGHSTRQTIAFSLGFILGYLQRCCGRMCDVPSYYFNPHLTDPPAVVVKSV